MYIASIKGMRISIARKRVTELLRQVGLAKMQNRKMKKLSGGMKRRAGAVLLLTPSLAVQRVLLVLLGLLQGAEVPALVILCCETFPTRTASASSIIVLGVAVGLPFAAPLPASNRAWRCSAGERGAFLLQM